MKLKVLLFINHYLPGYKSGGPVRTISNMVEQLGEEFDFLIVTSDRDALDEEPYPNVHVDKWNGVGKASVYYCSPSQRSLLNLSRLMRETDYEILYLNSFFSPRFSFLPLLAFRLGLATKHPCIVAPRGEFSKSALTLKSWKKCPFVFFTRLLGVHKEVTWQASSDYEKHDIISGVKCEKEKVLVASNLPTPVFLDDRPTSSFPSSGSEGIRVVFLSRITPMKNLDFAILVLKKVKSPISFDIYGPIRDEAYWERCQSLIDDLPSNVCVNYHGALIPREVPAALASYDLFFLPTLGENYGHIIAESISVGTPLLIADTTPWRGLKQAGVGWDLPLDNESLFVEAIESAAKIRSDERKKWRTAVKMYAREKLMRPEVVEDNRKLFLNHRAQV